MKFTYLMIAIIVFTSTQLTAKWEPCSDGIYGGIVRAVLALDDNIYAGTDAGSIFRSTDKGENWQLLYSVPGGSAILKFAHTDEYIYAGCYGAGVYRSDISGDNWESKNEGLKYGAINSFAFDGDDVYVGTLMGGLYRSTDNGDNWAKFASDSTDVMIIAIIDNKFFMSVWGKGIYVSDDQGTTWNDITGTLPTKNHLSLKKVGNDIVLGTWGSGVYRSSDYGANWTISNTGINNKYIWAIDEYDLGLIASTEGGMYKSEDGGHTWEKIGLDKIDVRSLSISGEDIYVGTLFGGVYYSSDSGLNWLERSKGIANALVSTVVASDNNIWAGTKGIGVYLSTNNGNNWTKKGLEKLYINAITVSGNNIFVGTDKGIYYSNNMGGSWAEKNNGLGHVYVKYLLIHNNNIYAATHEGGIYYSTDNGENWNQTNTGETNKYPQCIVAIGNTIYSGTNRGIFSSNDNGSTWKESYYSIAGGNDIRAMTVKDGAIYATSFYYGVLKSTDNGETWKMKNSGLNNQYALMNYALETFENILYLGTKAGVYISEDDGESWENYNDGIGSITINAFGRNGNTVFAATDGAGIYRSDLITSVIDVQFAEKDIFSIHPNPASDFITIQTSEVLETSEDSEIKIFNTLGVCVMNTPSLPSTSSGSGYLRMEVSHLPNGVYFVRIGSRIEKFLKM
jgi:photosystem II stability/assembly factor-like uncharacterized protein